MSRRYMTEARTDLKSPRSPDWATPVKEDTGRESPEVREAKSLKLKELWGDPQFREKRIDALRRTLFEKGLPTKQARARASAYMLERWKCPEYRKAQSASMVGRQNPNNRNPVEMHLTLAKARAKAWTPEARAKWHKNYRYTPARQLQQARRTAASQTPEAIANRAAATATIWTPEARAKREAEGYGRDGLSDNSRANLDKGRAKAWSPAARAKRVKTAADKKAAGEPYSATWSPEARAKRAKTAADKKAAGLPYHARLPVA